MQCAHGGAACCAGKGYGAEVVDYVCWSVADCDKFRQVFSDGEVLVDSLGRTEEQLAVGRCPFVHDLPPSVRLLDVFFHSRDVAIRLVAILERMRQTGERRHRRSQGEKSSCRYAVHNEKPNR